ncbi:MAG: phosphodiester glycosidase family protein [Polyangiaceae bacterium]
MALLWIAIHRVPWLGARLADTARAVVGTEAVSQVEIWAYGLDDRWNRFTRRGEAPAAHWSVPESPPAPRRDETALGAADDELPLFLPDNVGPFAREVAAKGDGVWVPVADFAEPDEPPVVYKTLLHPDVERSYAEVFVVAVDLRRTRLHAVAGTLEPEASTKEGERYARSGLIADKDRASLVLAFNGGFKTEHGQYGMKVDGVTLLSPRDKGCAIGGYDDGELTIRSWSTLSPDADELSFWRQTPACMVEEGKLHPGLASDRATSWGMAAEGGTVVRRSAIGLDAARKVLFVGVSNRTNARAMARAMQHAGAANVAQLDINWSYPHIVTFEETKQGDPEAHLLFDGFAYEEGTYLKRPARRDFFYLTRQSVESR